MPVPVMTPDYISEVMDSSPRPPSDLDSWTDVDDEFLKNQMQKYCQSGPFGKCNWKEVYRAFNGRFRQTALNERWIQLRRAHEARLDCPKFNLDES